MSTSQEMYESERIVLRERPGEQAVTQLAVSAGWTLLADNAGEPYAEHTREQTWGVRRGLHVYVLSDTLSEYSAITVLADDRESLEGFVSLLRDHLNPLARRELLEPIADFADPGERMLRLMRLALSAPASVDREIYAQLTSLAEDPDPRVRDAMTLAAGYLPWPQLRPVLKRMAEHDSYPTVRQDAANALQMFDDAGVPED